MSNILPTVVVLIIVSLGTMQMTSALNWVGTFDTARQCNTTGCCCVKGPVEIKASGNDDATMNINLHGLDCPPSPHNSSITNHTQANSVNVGSGNATLNGDNLIFAIAASGGSAQDPVCASRFQRKPTGPTGNNNNNSGSGSQTNFIGSQMLLFVQLSSLIILMMIFDFN